jgi:hypothetical protein
MKWEDKILLQYIEHNQLAKWLPATLDAAREQIMNEREDGVPIAAALNNH